MSINSFNLQAMSLRFIHSGSITERFSVQARILVSSVMSQLYNMLYANMLGDLLGYRNDRPCQLSEECH